MKRPPIKKTRTGKYAARDVDSYIAAFRADYERILKEQKERIITLREQNKQLKKRVDAYTENEKQICSVLIQAEITARKIIAEAEYTAADRRTKLIGEINAYQAAIRKYQEKIMRLEHIAVTMLKDITDGADRVKYMRKTGETRKTPAMPAGESIAAALQPLKRKQYG